MNSGPDEEAKKSSATFFLSLADLSGDEIPVVGVGNLSRTDVLTLMTYHIEIGSELKVLHDNKIELDPDDFPSADDFMETIFGLLQRSSDSAKFELFPDGMNAIFDYLKEIRTKQRVNNLLAATADRAATLQATVAEGGNGHPKVCKCGQKLQGESKCPKCGREVK